MIPHADRWAAERPDAPALHFGARTWSWRELARECRAHENALAALGLKPGDRLGVLGANCPETVFLLHAAARRGVALVLLNTRLTEGDWRAQLRHSRARAVLVGAELSRVELGVPRHLLQDLPAQPAPATQPVDPAGPLALLFTSGTTGAPRAAMLSAAALAAHARASALHLGSGRDDLHLCNLPLFHVGGLSMIFRAAECGGALLLHERFDAALLAADLMGRPVTHLSLVPTTLQRWLDQPEPIAAPSLRALLVGGAPLPAPLRERALARGLPVLATYGLTEAGSQVATVPPGQAARAGGASGLPLPGVRLRVVDERRAPLPPGHVGELEVQTPGAMLGYDADPNATAAALADGWLRTGDLGELDAEGWLTVHARRTDLILSGGENVYPAEVEAALLGVEGVRDAAVLARADATWGQVPIAAAVLREGLAPAEVLAALEGRLARYKLPREVVPLAELPRNANGKLARARLRELLGL